MALTEPQPTIPTAGALREVRRRFRRSHGPRPNRTGTAVLSALGVYVVAGIAWWLATRPPATFVEAVFGATGQGWDATSWNPGWAWVIGSAAVAAGIGAAQALGPLTSSAERAFWLLSTPVDRAVMLRPAVWAVFTGGAAAGATTGRFAAFAGSVEYWPPLAASGALAGVGVAALAVLVQASVLPTRTLPVLQVAAIVLGGGVAVACAAGTTVPVFVTWLPVVAVAVPVAATGGVALALCGRITMAQLREHAETAEAVRTSLIGLDPTILFGVHDARAWQRVVPRRSRVLPPGRIRALVRADLLRNLRRRSPFATAAVAVGCAWVLGTTAPPVVAAWIQLAAVFAATLAFSTGLRDLAGKPELRALLATADHHLYLASTVVPACVAAAVTVATAAVTGWSPVVCVLVACGACLATYRIRTRSRTGYDGLLLETAVGQVPVDLIRQWLRGPDVLACAAVLLALMV